MLSEVNACSDDSRAIGDNWNGFVSRKNTSSQIAAHYANENKKLYINI